ncbi:MMPL family transporter [Microbacterium sp. No. 7]|uniref:MMPL family transporter n=1 Tax=Microbacterium sp. No. 7 TaxID=1714373 RepID=UPI0006D0C214|nr:MMPL family transporter [Microbacterium sp. No. 7]ALJ18676.1 RND transporter [Microbacterium sp. No. 7]
MANLLYRLARFSARRPWTVVTGWLVALALAAGAFLSFGGALAMNLSIPGTETERVNDRLVSELPDLGGATGTVVFRTDDGAALDAGQRAAISALLDDVRDVDRVADVVDPFAADDDRATQEQELTDGAAQLDDAREQIADGRAQLDDAQSQLDAGRAQAEAAGIAEALAPLDAQQAQLDEARTALDDGAAELEEQAATIDAAQRLLAASATLRTVSEDQSTALAAVLFQDDLFNLSDDVKNTVAELLEGAGIDGVTVDYSSEIAAALDGLIGPGEIIGVLLAGLVLVITFRALLPAVLPLISSVIGVGVGVAGSLAFSDLVTMTSITPILGVMLGLAVGIDYALFIVHRHRRQLLLGMETHESIGLAGGTAGNAVVFAGTIVIIALLALGVTGIPFLGVMGAVGAACVLVAVLMAVTFVPALLGLVKQRVLSRRARTRIGAEEHAPVPLKPMRTSRAVLGLAAGIIGLLIVAAPALSMRLGLPDGSTEAQDSTQHRAYTAVAEEFGAGLNGPLLVVAELPAAAGGDELAIQAELAELLAGQADVAAAAPVGISDDGAMMAFQVVPREGPTSESTEELVHALRALSPLDDGTTLGVAGQASGNIDISAKLAEALPLYLVVIVGLSLVILVLVFRSIVVPLIATAGFVLSLFAALGAVTAVYQWGWLGAVFDVHTPGPILNFAPVIILGVLFGLAMDYQLFLVSGMREAHVHGVPARAAVMSGLRAGRAVVTAAAIIMAAVFGGFIFSHLGTVRALGFGLAIGVLFDAFVVRMLIVPAAMHLVGEKAWWLPRWLDRMLPNVDIEGAALERSHPVHAPVAEPAEPALQR